ncbi:MAG: hypothetical protein ACTSPD_09240 [Promethearchaeota archaeon]
MIENVSLKYEKNISKVLDRAVKLFHNTGLHNLAEKWDRILSNYIKSKISR